MEEKYVKLTTPIWESLVHFKEWFKFLLAEARQADMVDKLTSDWYTNRQVHNGRNLSCTWRSEFELVGAEFMTNAYVVKAKDFDMAMAWNFIKEYMGEISTCQMMLTLWLGHSGATTTTNKQCL
jgi:hypothetical protein